VIRLAALAVSLCGLATQSVATEWISCASPDGGASFDFLVGAMDVLAIVGVTVTAGEQVWASDAAYGPGDPLSIGQAFEDERMILVDAVDPNITTRIAELRLFKAEEAGFDPVLAGTLRIPGHGVWSVSCVGP
jgi:hypothetical protein